MINRIGAAQSVQNAQSAAAGGANRTPDTRSASQNSFAAALRQGIADRKRGESTQAANGAGISTQAANGTGISAQTVSGAGGFGQGGGVPAVNFSRHALARVEERGIELTPGLMEKLSDSVEKAQEKGAKNILAFDATRAFIINIPYGRVITAMSQEEMRENIFTNIDGAVLL